MNKVIIIFAIVLVIFVGVVAFQMSKGLFKHTESLQTTEVLVKDHTFTAEIASTSAQRQQGLTGRNKIDADHGMLFVFETADMYSFWMKEMKFPIDILFIENTKVVSLVENAQPPVSAKEELPLFQSKVPASRALEIQAGLVKKYGIKVGDTVKIAL